MKCMRSLIRGFSLLFPLLFSLQIAAQDLLPLDAAMIRRLGLVFARVAAPDNQAGALSPARIISSPYLQSDIVARYSGVLSSWEVEPGQIVEADSLLGLVHSPEVLALQQNWLSARAEEQQNAALLQRDKQLFADGIIAASRLQLAEHEYNNARIRLQAAGRQL